MAAPITLAAIPSAAPGDGRAALDAVCAALGDQLGRTVNGAFCESYDQLTADLERDRVHYAWMPPVLLVLTRERVQLQPLLSAVREDRVEYYAVLFVDGGGGISMIEQLRGKTVAWVDPTSASGYLSPRLHLAALGVDPTALFGGELFLRSHAEVVCAVFDGRADVGATYSERPAAGEPIRRAGFSGHALGHRARVIDWTGPIPNDCIAGHGHMPWHEHREFLNAVIALSQRDDGKRLLHAAFHAERFAPITPASLRPLHDMVDLARTNGLLPHL